MLKKDDLLELGDRLELEARKSIRKIELVRIISEHMVDNDVFDEAVLIGLTTDSSGLSQAQIELEKAKIEADLEKVRIGKEIEAELEKERIRTGKETELDKAKTELEKIRIGKEKEKETE